MKIEDIRIDKEFAKRLPKPPEREFQALVDSVNEFGIVVPLSVTRDGLLLDGHRRLEAAQKAGLSSVPVSRYNLSDQGGWEKTVAILTNLHRRHLNEAQRADLGSSLLRVERKKANDRQRAGKGADGSGGRGKKKPSSHGNRKVSTEDEAVAKVARDVGVSRNTMYRVQAVKKADPKLAKDMLAGKVSVASANRALQRKAAEKLKDEAPKLDGNAAHVVNDLSSPALEGAFRTIYLDPPWGYLDQTVRGAAANQYPTLSLQDLCDQFGTPLKWLANPKGAHMWLWTTWPMLRDGAPQKFLSACGFEWKSEIVWDKQSMGLGRWVRKQTEILILGVRGKQDRLREDVADLVSIKHDRGKHSAKPEAFRDLVESFSPGPYIEIFARGAEPRKGWLFHGFEAP